MRKKLLLIHFLILCLGFLGLCVPVQGQSRVPRRIQKITIQGNETIDKDTIIFRIHSKIGTLLDIYTIRRDIKALYNTGFFEDVQVNAEIRDEGLHLIYRVSERPVIKDIVITGAEKIPLNTLNDELTVEKGKIYNPSRVKESSVKIEAKYREKGYNFAVAIPRLIPAGKGAASLIFNVDEGTKVIIDSIEFDGNEAFMDGTRLWGLRSRMKENREKWMFSLLTGSGKLNEEMLADDLKMVEEYYKNRGYLRASVGTPQIVMSDPHPMGKEKRRVKITIPVVEGDIYRIGKVEAQVGDESIVPLAAVTRVIQQTRLEKYSKFFGGSLFIKAGPRMETGEVYSYELEQEVITSLSEQYGMLGYIYAFIQPERSIDDERRVVDLKFTISEGEQAFLRKLEFIGNDRTRDRVLRRNFLVAEGDVFNTALIKNSIARIQYLGFIDEVEPIVKPQADMSQVDVTVKVNDNKQTEIQLAGGYSDYEKFYGTLGLSEHNLFGRGQELNLSVTSGKRTQSYSISFADEWIMDRPYYGAVSVWNTTRDYDYSDQRSLGGSLKVGRSFGLHYSTRLGYKYERNRVFNIADTASQEVKDLEGTQNTSSITSTWIRDTLNNRRDPSQGAYSQFDLELAGGPFGGDNDFYKLRLSHSYYRPLLKNLVVDVRAEINYADAFNGNDLPFYERYSLGGPRSIRGYQDNSIGPWDEYGQNLRGNKSIELTAELIIPIAGPLKTVMFVDAGDVYSKDDMYDLRTLRPSAGFEIRFTIPGFYVPLRFIWGYNLDPLEGEDRNDFQFTMGTVF